MSTELRRIFQFRLSSIFAVCTILGIFCFVFTSIPYLIPYFKGPVYLTGKALKCLRRGDLDNALAFANRAVQFGPDFSHTYETRAEVLEARGDFRASIRDYTKVVSLREYGALAQRGRVYEKMGEHDNAAADYCEALLIDRTESRLAFNVGCVALNRVRRPGEYSGIEQRHPDAVSSLLKFIEEAIERDPDNRDLRACRELILRSEGDGSIPALPIGSG